MVRDSLSLLSVLLILVLLQACPVEPEGSGDAGTRSDGPITACQDCPAQTHCVDEQCVPDCDCPEGQACAEAGQCYQPCTDDQHCERGTFCDEERCQPGCATDDACGEQEICEGLRCVPAQCLATGDCQTGEACEARRCLARGEVLCESTADCARDWRCSSHGLCFTGDCLVHDDCSTVERCHSGRCLSRISPEHGVHFERRYVPPVTDHLARLPVLDRFQGYGLGAALFDVDGDLDLDLFLGLQQSNFLDPDARACIYENHSLPSQLRFRPLESHCSPALGSITNAFGVDLEGDGFHELVALGTGVVQLWRFHPEVEVIDLLEQLDEAAPGRACEAGAVASMDLNFDGRADLVIGCQSPLGFSAGESTGQPADMPIVHVSELQNLVFVQGEDGSLLYSDDPALIGGEGDHLGLMDDGVSLALGTIDLDEDGLLDLLVANDWLIWGSNGHEGGSAPGAVYYRCGPDEDCLWEWSPLAQGGEIFSNFMGFGSVHIDGLGDCIYVSDAGANHCARFEGRRFSEDLSLSLQIDLSDNEGVSLFGWGVIVEDFNRDGRDDIYVSNGAVPYQANLVPLSFAKSHDGLLLQQEAAGFLRLQPEEVGLAMPNVIDSAGSQRPYAGRAAAKADLDGDGFLEILTLPMEGYLRIQAEVPTTADVPPRCTLVPRPRYVPAYGFGYAVAGPTGDDWRRRDMQGQMRFGASPFVLSTLNQGRLRFPSGAEVDFDCGGGPGPLVVEEPEWVRLIYQENRVKLRLTTPWTGQGLPELQVLFQGPGGRRLFQGFHDGIGWDLQPLPEETRMMFQLDGKWLGRWFPTR